MNLHLFQPHLSHDLYNSRGGAFLDKLGAQILSIVERLSALRGSLLIKLVLYNKLPVHCREVVCFSEGPLEEVPLLGTFDTT